MKIEFSDDELELVRKVKSTARWDHLWYGLSTTIPCAVIIFLGIYFDAAWVVVVGAGMMIAMEMRMHFHQAKVYPLWQSIMKKITDG